MRPKADPIQTVLARFRRLNYRHVLPDACLIVVSLYASLYLRLGAREFGDFVSILNRNLLLFVVLRLGCMTVLGAYDIIWRFISFNDAIRLFRAIAISSVIIIAASFMIDLHRLPRTVFVIDTVLVSVLLGGLRFLRRLLYESSSEKQLRQHGRLTLIFGAGMNGRTLAHRFSADGLLGFNVIGFVDDDAQKVGRLVSGVKVLGTSKQLPELLEAYGVQELIVAIGDPAGEVLRDIVQVCRNYGVQPRLITDLKRSDRKSLNLFRKVGLTDLLNRPRKEIQVEALRALVRNRRVLVTGAGGSIGSELARQILSFEPGMLMLLDHSEFNLYQIDQELRTAPGDQTDLVVPLLVDIKDRGSLTHAFEKYTPELVFHAAAYKHVHLVEQNPYAAILNNVQGTQNLLDLCERHEVETFVLISTDKAVNPAGIMGMTKRLCELLVTEAGERLNRRYCAVRFGNVLGSSGSLIPLLKSQIESGEPVTITHKDMTRYFMLIPEAVSLVLKAASIAQPGDISILRMGEPVKIVDIARSLIALMGKSEEEVPLVFTGLRPGEKMFEELYLCGNEIKTADPDILVLPKGDGVTLESAPLHEVAGKILEAAARSDKQSVLLLKGLINSNYRVPVESLAPHTPAQPNPEEPRLWQ